MKLDVEWNLIFFFAWMFDLIILYSLRGNTQDQRPEGKDEVCGAK